MATRFCLPLGLCRPYRRRERPRSPGKAAAHMHQVQWPIVAPHGHCRKTRYRSSRCREPFAAEASLRLASRASSARGCSGRSSQATRGRLTSAPPIVFLMMSTTRSSRLERRRVAAVRAILRFETSDDSVIKLPFGDRDGAHHSRRMAGEARALVVRLARSSQPRRRGQTPSMQNPRTRNSRTFWLPKREKAPPSVASHRGRR